MWTGKKYCIGVVGVVCFTWNDNIVLFILIAELWYRGNCWFALVV